VPAESAAELLEQAEALAAKATGEPWTTMPLAGPNPTTAIQRPCPGRAATPVGKAWAPEDAEFMAAARSLVPALAARLRDALTVVEAARELRARSEYEPLDIDISDYSDEYGIAFLAGQTNALDAVFDAGPAAAEEEAGG
jgi:hypothetical protein